MTPLPLSGTLIETTPIGLIVLTLSLAITAGWLYHIYQ
jgi:hypothetical protein